jgi:endo-1,4-beta-xylanase
MAYRPWVRPGIRDFRRFRFRRIGDILFPMPSLAEVYRPFFPVGAAVDARTIVTQKDLLSSQVNSLVAENDMKWERIHPRPGDGTESFDFSNADRIVAFALERGMKVRGHTLVWHQQCPGWVFQAIDGSGSAVSKPDLLERMRRHVGTLLSRYRGKVYCWDVVNEALAEDGQWRTDSPWHRIAGVGLQGHWTVRRCRRRLVKGSAGWRPPGVPGR